MKRMNEENENENEDFCYNEVRETKNVNYLPVKWSHKLAQEFDKP